MSDSLIDFRGFTGSCRYSEDDGMYWGKITNTKDLIMFSAKTVDGLQEAFHIAVIEYQKGILDLLAANAQELGLYDNSTADKEK
jgi:predicted HicB family RNase H-like nuclease